MKIFLNNRVVELHGKAPENKLPSEMVVAYESPGKLQEHWLDFERYEQFTKFIIVDSSVEPSGADTILNSLKTDPVLESTAFKEFKALFKYVPAAGGLVKNEKGEFLFIHRLGFWDLPKGKIDKSDLVDADASIHDLSSARNAAIREVMEETGLRTVSVTGTLPSTWHIYTAKEKRILKQTSWFQMEADSLQILKPQTSEGIFLVKWTPSGAIHCILTHTYASLRELLLELIF